MRRRPSLTLSLIAIGLLTAAQAPFPYEGVVEVQKEYLHVRSGPSENHYLTGGLKRGERVTVVGEEDGWLAIEPPPDSFSWVSGEYLRPISPAEAEVTGDNVNVRVGSTVNEEKRDATRVQLSRGDRVQVLGKKTFGSGRNAQEWYKIAPPAGEVRWVQGQYIRTLDGRPVQPGARGRTGRSRAGPAERVEAAEPADSGAPPAGSGATAPDAAAEPEDPEPAPELPGRPGDTLEQAEAAYRSMMGKSLAERDLAAVRALYEQAARMKRGGADPLLIQRRLREIEDQEERQSKLKEFEQIIEQAKQRNRVLLSMARKKSEESSRPSAPRYDGSGMLRRSAVTIDGKPAYVLLNPQGGLRSYVTPAPGLDLSPYLNQPVAVRGQTRFRTELRAQHILVRDIAPIDVAPAGSPEPE